MKNPTSCARVSESGTEQARVVVFFQLLAFAGIILPFLWLDARVEWDDGEFIMAAYEWAINGLPRVPAWIDSPGGDDHLHLLWLSVSGIAAMGIKLFSGFMSITTSARLPMVLASSVAVLMLGVRGSAIIGPIPAWCSAAFLSLDSIVFLNARTVRPEALLLPLFAWVMLWLIAIIKEQSSAKYAFPLGIILGISALAIHPNALIIPACLLVGAYVSVPKRMVIIKTALWCSVGVALGLILYSALISSLFSDFSNINKYLISDTLISAKNTIIGRNNYIDDLLLFLRKWTVFPYRAIIFICIFFSIIAVRKEQEFKFLALSALIYLLLYPILRGSVNGSVNVRYMAYLSLLIAPVIGLAYGSRHKILNHRWASIFTLILFITLFSGFGNVIESYRCRPNTEIIQSILKTDIPKDAPIISSLWVAGVAPERRVIHDVYASEYLKAGKLINKDEKFYYIEDGLYSAQVNIKELFREKGFTMDSISEHNDLYRLKYLRVMYLSRPHARES